MAMSLEEYKAEQKRTDELIGERAKDLIDSTDPGLIWRMRDIAAVQLGVLALTYSPSTHELVVERQKPWAKLKLKARPANFRNGRGVREATYDVLEVEPRYLIEAIAEDPVLKSALFRVVDDGGIDGSARHFGGRTTALREGSPFTVTVWTD